MVSCAAFLSSYFPHRPALLATHLILHIGQASREVHCEANQDDVALRVAERTQSIVLFLPCCIPERQLDCLALEAYDGDVVLEYRGDVRVWESVL